MIHRLTRGEIPDKPHTVFEVDGKLTFEHCFTRMGFESIYTIMWHREPPHWVESEENLGRHPGWAEPETAGPLRRSHYLSDRQGAGRSPFLARRLLFSNSDIGVWLGRATESEPTLVANADGDELVFVHEGSGRVETALGVVPFVAQDYVYMPQGLPHRWILDGPALLLTVEGRSPVRVPKQYRVPEGQLSMYAPYTHHDFVEPQGPEGGPETLDAPRRLIVQNGGMLTAFGLSHDPFDVVGWMARYGPSPSRSVHSSPRPGRSTCRPPSTPLLPATVTWCVPSCRGWWTSPRVPFPAPIHTRRRIATRSCSTLKATSPREKALGPGR